MSHRFHGWATAVCTLVALFWPVSSPLAQARMVGNVLVRPDLKGPPPPPPPSSGFVAQGVATGAEMICPRFLCQTPILVTRGGFTDPGMTNWDPTHCSVYWPYYDLRVKKTHQPTLRWVLVKDPADPATYAFDATYGIKLQPNPLDPSDYNDITQDLYNYRREGADGAAFVWQDLHTRPAAKIIFFVPTVYRVGNEGRPCNAGDPLVVNEN